MHIYVFGLFRNYNIGYWNDFGAPNQTPNRECFHNLLLTIHKIGEINFSIEQKQDVRHRKVLLR